MKNCDFKVDDILVIGEMENLENHLEHIVGGIKPDHSECECDCVGGNENLKA